MADTRTPRNCFFAILVAGILEGIHDFPLLPARMASHFGPSGMPNGWMTKSQFLLTYALVLLPALAVEFWMPRRIAMTSGERLRLPNKEYWLAPERRDATFAYFEKFFAWYGCAFLGLEVFAMTLAMRANLVTPPHLTTGPIALAIAAFLLFNLAAVIAMIRRFSNVK